MLGEALFLWPLPINKGLEWVWGGVRPSWWQGLGLSLLGIWRKGASPQPHPHPCFQSNPWVPPKKKVRAVWSSWQS